MIIRLLLPMSMTCFADSLQDHRHAKLCLSVIILLICVCWHPERICRALSS